MHKGFKCLDPAEGHVYISHDIVFDESVFPFTQLHPNAGTRLRFEISLLPDALLSPISCLGDAIVHDLSASSPMSTNPLMSSARSPDHAGSNVDENSSDLGDHRRYFMCPGHGDSNGPRVEADSAAPGSSDRSPSGSGGRSLDAGPVAAASSSGASPGDLLYRPWIPFPRAHRRSRCSLI